MGLDDFPIKISIDWGFAIDTLNYRRLLAIPGSVAGIMKKIPLGITIKSRENSNENIR